MLSKTCVGAVSPVLPVPTVYEDDEEYQTYLKVKLQLLSRAILPVCS